MVKTENLTLEILFLNDMKKILHTGFEDLKKFELIDRLEKPVLDFTFTGNKKKIIEVYDLLSEYPYAFTIRTNKGFEDRKSVV